MPLNLFKNRLFLILLVFTMKTLHAEDGTLILRPAKLGEEGVLYDFIRELALYEKKDVDKLPLTLESLKTFGFSGNPYFLTEFAEVEGVVVGYALYFYTFSASLGSPILYLEDLYVKPDYRNRGIGSELLKKLALYAREKQCCRLEWHVFNWNEPAQEFYRKLGAEFKEDLLQVRLNQSAMEKLLD